VNTNITKHSVLQLLNLVAMDEYILYTGMIDGQYKNVEIYPVGSVDGKYLIHWDGFEVGAIMKIGLKWYSNSVPLMNVVNELGVYIDEQNLGDGI
jgi:hypothetical protein